MSIRCIARITEAALASALEKKSVASLNVYEIVDIDMGQTLQLRQHTLRAFDNSFAIRHSSLVSWHLRRLKSPSLVIDRIAALYSHAKLSISPVEFQRVGTSRGMILGASSFACTISFHRGNSFVGEFLIECAIFRSYKGQVRNMRS